MKQPSKIVRFGFSLIAMLLVAGLVYAGGDTQDQATAIVAQVISASSG